MFATKHVIYTIINVYAVLKKGHILNINVSNDKMIQI